jgi:hypothetical protein
VQSIIRKIRILEYGQTTRKRSFKIRGQQSPNHLTAFEKSIQLEYSIKIIENCSYSRSKSNTRLFPGKKGAKGHNIAPSGNSCW